MRAALLCPANLKVRLLLAATKGMEVKADRPLRRVERPGRCSQARGQCVAENSRQENQGYCVSHHPLPFGGRALNLHIPIPLS
jgi:hypothetical protein